MGGIFNTLFASLFVAFLLSCSSSVPAPADNISFDLPPALTKAAAEGDLEAHFIGVTGSEKPKDVILTISPDGKVSGSMTVKPGRWTFEVQFYQVAKSGDLLPIAFFHFDEKDVSGEKLDLTYEAKDLKFNEVEPDGKISPSVSPSIPPPDGTGGKKMCKKRYDCDEDGFSNWEEILAGSDPFDPKSVPVKPVTPAVIPPPPPPPLPAITVNLTEGQVVKDVVNIQAEATSPSGIKAFVLNEPDGIADRNGLAEVFQANWDTTTLPDDSDVTLTFVARDNSGKEATLKRKVRIDNVPNIKSFGKDALIQAGSSAPLSWEADNFTSLTLNGGKAEAKETRSVNPSVTTTYKLTATRTAGGKSFPLSKEVTIRVNYAPNTPTVGTGSPKLLGTAPGDVRFNWTGGSPDSDDAGCKAVTYDLVVTKGDGKVVFTRSGLSDPTFDPSKLTGPEKLEPRTDYRWQVTARDACGASVTSDFFNFTTADTGLVGWWRFEGDTKDSSGKGNNGTLNGPTGGLPAWVEGTAGKALQFDGVDDYVRVKDSRDLELGAGDFTVEAWIKPISFQDDKTSGGINALVHRGPSERTNCGTTHLYFGIRVEFKLNVPAYQVCDSTLTDPGTGLSTAQTRTALVAGVWSHLVVVHKLTDNPDTITFYLNGQRQGTVINPNGNLSAIQFKGSDLFIGSLYGVQSFFNGLIDEVAIYNRPLTTSEIRASCRRNDPTGSTCAADDVPEQVTTVNNIPPTTLSLSWKTIGSKTPASYELCYKYETAEKDYTDFADPKKCPNVESTTSPSFLVDPLVANKTYRWKVRACFGEGSCSAYSPVWEFRTDGSLVGWWRLNEGSGKDVKDSSGKGRDGILTTGDVTKAWVDGVGGKAVFLNDTSSDYVEVANHADLSLGKSNFAISAWVNRESGNSIILDKASLGLGDDRGYQLYFYDANYFTFWTPTCSSIVSSRYPTMGWVHVAVVRKGSIFSLYLNGGLKTSGFCDVDLSSTANLRIGRRHDGGQSFKGKMDEISILNRSLTSTEVRESCRNFAPSGVTCTGEDAPIPLTPSNKITLPPTRAFLSWRQGEVPAGKEIKKYETCYTNVTDTKNGYNAIGPDDQDHCPNKLAVDSVKRFRVLDPLVKTNLYLWKVRACYNDTCTDSSLYSDIQEFSIDDSLVGWWKFDEATGVTAADFSGNGRNGTLSCTGLGCLVPIWKVGEGIGGALLFDGVDDYVDLTSYASTLAFSKADNYTMETRFRTNVSSDGILIQLSAGAGGVPDSAFVYSPDGNINYHVTDVRGDRGHPDSYQGKDYGPSFLDINTTSGGFSDSIFHHAVGVYRGDSATADDCSGTVCTVDPTPPQISLFVDGNLKGTKSGTIYPFGASDFAKAAFGRASNASLRYFKGLIDEVAIYKTNLSAEAIKNNYCSLEALAGTDMAKDPKTGVCR